MVSGTIGEARYLLKPAIKRCLDAIEPRQEIGAQVLDEQKRVLAVAVGPIEPALVHILTHLGELAALRKQAPADLVELLGVIGAHIEHLLRLGLVKGIDPHRKDRQLSRAAARLVKPALVRIESGRRWLVDLAHALNVLGVRGQATVEGCSLQIKPTRVEVAQYLLGGLSQLNAQVIHQLKLTLLGEPGK